MKPFFQHAEPLGAFVASVDVGTAEDFAVVTLWERTADGRHLLLDYREARQGEAIQLALPGGTQVLVEESDIRIVR